MKTIAGYHIQEQIYESENSLVYRGRQAKESQSVILKMLKQSHPPPEKISRFQREYELIHGLDLEGVIKAHALTTDQHHPVMVLEDFGGESLKLHLGKRSEKRFTLAEFFPLAEQIVDILDQLHQQHIAHQGVNPSNIVWSPRTGQVKLIDFGVSTALTHENLLLRDSSIEEGTLAYISPEQTGRMNQALDDRTDWYSLGVTFYEFLTGRLPFPTADTLALIHAHIAKDPPPPHELVSDIPQLLSALVMKLMAKNAEDRYQSAYGLKRDLEECQRQWKDMGRIAPFRLGQHDIPIRFHVPQKLYGREAALDTLLAAVDRVKRGASELMLVSGPAGVGKSALVQEVDKRISRQCGYFITGKCDQLHNNIPYAPLVQAFRSLVRQLLMESEAELTSWREHLLAAFGLNGQVIIDLLPEVALIVGPQPAVPALPPAEAQNRLHVVFHNFIRVFTKTEHPLVLFLDDLQWVDAASLQLVRLLMTAPDNRYLLVIGAYRDTEVPETHPLRLALDAIRNAESAVLQIVLQPLDLASMRQLTADALACSLDRAAALAALLFAKTHGNPFFVHEFLKLLYAEDLLTPDFRNGGWQWDLASIQAHDTADNLVELLSAKLRKLREQTQQVVKFAACIGNQFDLHTLAIVYERSLAETAANLWEALEEGLVLPLGDTYKIVTLEAQELVENVSANYKFAHDRIQQAAYALIPEMERQRVHRQIGRLLLQNTPVDERDRNIFDIANHLNLGREFVNDQAERDELVALNILAGRRAKAAAAYEAAFNYFQSGLTVLNEDCWERQYDSALTLHVEAAEAAYLSGGFGQAKQLIAIVLQQARTLLDKVRAYEVSLRASAAQHKPQEAIETGLQVLELLGMALSPRPSRADTLWTLEETQRALAGKDVEGLIDLPEMTDPYKVAAMRILASISHSAYVGSPELVHLIVCRMVNLSVGYGNTSLSAQAYATYGGLICCGILGAMDVGHRFGTLALAVVERLRASNLKARTTFMVNSFIRPWKEHIKATLQPLLEGYQSGLQTGDLLSAALCAFDYGFQAYWSGQELIGLERDLAKYSNAINQLRQKQLLYVNELYRQAVLNLLGKAEDPRRLIGESYDEEEMLPHHLKAHDRNALCQIYLNKFLLCYVFHDYPQAGKNAALAEAHLDSLVGTAAVPAFYLYDSLTRLALLPDVQASEHTDFLEKIAVNQEKMQFWAQHAPMNYLHKFYLVEAERARVLRKDGEAREFYDKAITLAHDNEYLNEEALAYELAGRFYLARGQSHLARYYLHDAHYAYRRWGALAKVQDLEKNYPQFFETRVVSDVHQPVSNIPAPSTEPPMSTTLDARSVLKASQAIAGEIVLDRLLTKLMRIVIENAGAQRGVLILEKDGQLMIEAEGTIERDDVIVLQPLPVEERPDLPAAIVRYVERTKETVVLSDATRETVLAADPYITKKQPKSALCAPLVRQGKLTGILYLENNLTAGAFTPDRVEILNMLSAEAAISIENARLYLSLEEANERLADYSKNLEQRVEERTQALQEKNWELEIANQQVQEASRRKSQFLAGMSHELRTPMNAILGFTRLVLRRAGDLLPERQRDNLVKVRESADHLLGLINQLLDLSRLEAGRMEIHPEPFDVKQFIVACCEMVSPLVKSGVHLKQEIADTIGEAYLDEEGLRHVVINLLSNAIKFTDAGEVVVRAQVERQANDDATLVVTVADTGVGIPADALDTIFEEFQQVEGGVQKREGTGLGLPIAKKWVELLGGSIGVESEPGKGSTFTVRIPVVYREQETLTESVAQ
jgi:predicted ATPase/signal transduction histidine kinase/tRNA A-37 threonylcarbamoyl transferase component Bud32